jgi:pimeloyl-ACP methyl ester carboxylesterase
MMTAQAAEAMQYAERGPSPDLASLPDRQLRRLLRNREATALFGWSPYLNDPKLGQRLHRVTCPTLLIWGAEDALAPPAYREAYESALPDAEVAMLSPCGHRLYAEQPARTAELIAGFAAKQRISAEDMR